MKNHIIVTGDVSFVGSNLINLLLKKPTKKCISLDDYSTSKKENYISSKNHRVKYLTGNT